MCLPPDVTPSPPSIGRRRESGYSQWAVDQRPFEWAAPHFVEKAAYAFPTWAETFNLASPRPSGENRSIEDTGRGVSDVLAPSWQFVSSPTASPLIVAGEAQKIWGESQQPGWEASPAVHPSLSSPQATQTAFSGGLNFPLHLPKSSLSGSGGLAASCSTSPMIAVSVVESQHNKVPHLDTPHGRLVDGEKTSVPSWVRELITSDSMSPSQKPSDSQTLKGPSVSAQKSSKQFGRHPVKKEVSTNDVFMSESLSDNEGSDEDGGEDAPVISEKRRKRMLSNRASAQRSRQRRQERLDTLEVLVAQLRVENAALTRKANSAMLAASKFEQENRTLRTRLDMRDSVSLSSSNLSNGSEQSIDNGPILDDDENSEYLWEARRPGLPKTQVGKENLENRCPNANGELSDRNLHARGVKTDEQPVEELRPWNTSSDGSHSVFNSDLMNVAGRNQTKGLQETAAQQVRIMVDCSNEYGVIKGLTTRALSFQDMGQFDIDLERNPDVDKKILGAADEIWLESLTEYLK